MSDGGRTHQAWTHARPAAAIVALLVGSLSVAALARAWADTGPVSAAGTETPAPRPRNAEPAKLPAHMTAIDGAEVNLDALLSVSTVVIVTLKSATCPVCATQLERLAARDEALRACGARFVVLAPGPSERLAELRRRSGFDHPFVEDRDLEIAAALDLRLSETELVPAILVLDGDRSVAWALRGRAAGAYGEEALLEKLACSEKLRA